MCVCVCACVCVCVRVCACVCVCVCVQHTVQVYNMAVSGDVYIGYKERNEKQEC